ncbi:MAG: HYR domain-containing protein, partial [Saprospiraceae bacterium]|nr:HYR domain-containing protein [Saprospiraceae bacterium]
IDNIAPTIVCPGDITVANDPGACGAILDFTDQIIAKDNCSYTLTYSKNPGSFFDIGTTPVTITITDLSGNSKSCTFNIIVEDREAPKTLPLAPIQISCDASTDPNNTGIASFSDNCGIINIGFSDRIVPGTCADDYAILRTWSASDAAGNTTSFVQEITILPDRILPICTNCPSDITVSCESIPDFPNLIATDNCDPNPAIDISQTSTQKLDRSCQEFAYEITRTFTITDRCGNASVYKQIITVIDETAPIITCPGDVTVDCRDIYNLEITGMAIATDNCDANPTIEYQDEVVAGDCEWECTVKRTWMATDACGNSSSCVQTIIRTAVGLVKTALGEAQLNWV